MRISLLIYILVMVLSSTWELLGSIYLFMEFFGAVDLSDILYRRPFGLLLAMCGADWFMIWRCLVLYQGVSRVARALILVLLSLISLASFACGVAAFVEDVTFGFKLRNAHPVFILLSAFINIILAALIVFRLVYHRRNVRNALGAGHGPPYTNIITMCVESSALMVIASGLYTIMVCTPLCILRSRPWDGATFMFDIIPHICVISPLLIVYRVAIGRAVPPSLWKSEQVMDQIRFNVPLSNPSGQEGAGE